MNNNGNGCGHGIGPSIQNAKIRQLRLFEANGQQIHQAKGKKGHYIYLYEIELPLELIDELFVIDPEPQLVWQDRGLYKFGITSQSIRSRIKKEVSPFSRQLILVAQVPSAAAARLVENQVRADYSEYLIQNKIDHVLMPEYILWTLAAVIMYLAGAQSLLLGCQPYHEVHDWKKLISSKCGSDHIDKGVLDSPVTLKEWYEQAEEVVYKKFEKDWE